MTGWEEISKRLLESFAQLIVCRTEVGVMWRRQDSPMIVKAAALLGLLLPLLGSGCTWLNNSGGGPAGRPQQTIQKDITFLTIVGDADTEAADVRLKRFIEGQIAQAPEEESASRWIVRFPHQKMPYGEVIRAFVERDSNKAPYLARMTPYAYVAAEMLGAKLDILAIYNSVATGTTIYNSYFVVRRQDFYERLELPANRADATLEDLLKYLNLLETKPAKFKPPKFIYHDRFSTSSYFLPSLYFRDHKIFFMTATANRELVPIQVEKFPSTSSGALVTEVAHGGADLAAVWDGTKRKFDKANTKLMDVEEQLADTGLAEKDRTTLSELQATLKEQAGVNDLVLFIKIPKPLPNDFLVSSGVNARTRRLIVEAIKKDPAAGRMKCPEPKFECLMQGDDFNAWYAWDRSESDAQDSAREALAMLRQDARPRPAPVVVDIKSKPGADVPDEYVSAAKEAVRLSGTEFVLYDPDLHEHVDTTWILESPHDHALTLTSSLEDFSWTSEPVPLSFVDRNDLPKRIADLARSRLPRIRYVWPYEQKYPAVLRDLDFTPGHVVLVQRISWLDPTRNFYEQDTPFEAQIERNTDFTKFKLSEVIKFPRNSDGSFNFEPMSNVAYRVVIQRESEASWIWTALPYCFIGLLLFAGLGFVVDLRRKQPPPRGLQQTYQHFIEAYHRPWRQQEIEEGDILWSDPSSIDILVKELKTKGALLDVVRSGGLDFNLGPVPVRFSILMKLGSQLFTRRPQFLLETTEAGDVAALDALIHVLLRRRRLSPFVGFPESSGRPRVPVWPLEWEALNDIVSRHFQQLGISQKTIDATLDQQNGELSAVVSSHFRGVIKRGMHDASLFLQTWDLGGHDVPGQLVCEKPTRCPLSFRSEDGPVSRVRIEVSLPSGAGPRGVVGRNVQAWVFGKIIASPVENGTLSLHLKPIAILKDHAH